MRDVTARNSKRSHSEETRQKLSEHWRERPPMTAETRRKFAEFKKYKKMSNTVIVVSDDGE